MTDGEALDTIRSVLAGVAPDGDIDSLSPDDTIQEGLGMDSVDFLNFVAGLQDRTGADIRERDYPLLTTVAGCIEYLTS